MEIYCFVRWLDVSWLKKILSVRDCEMLYAVVKKNIFFSVRECEMLYAIVKRRVNAPQGISCYVRPLKPLFGPFSKHLYPQNVHTHKCCWM